MALYLNNNGTVYKNPAVSSDLGDISFFGWIKIDTNDQYHQIFFNGHGGGYGQGYAFKLTDVADGQVLAIDVSYVAWLESSLQITDNNWHFVGFTRRASDGVWTIYLDSSSETMGSDDPYGIGAESRTIVGGENIDTVVSAESSAHFAEYGYWERLLTGTEITNLLGGDKPNEISTSNLLMYLPMDDAFASYNAGSGGRFSESGTWTLSTHVFSLPSGPRLVGYADNGGSSTSATVTKPSDVQAGDILIAVVHANGPRDISDSNGGTPFTSVLANREYNGPSAQVDIFRRVAGGSEPSTYTFTLASSDRWAIGLYVIRGADTTTIFDITPTSTTENTGSGSTNTTDSITVATNAFVIAFAVNDSNTVTFTGYPADSFRAPISRSGNQLLGMAYKYFGTGGTQSAISWTQSASNGTWLNNIFSILVASSGTSTNDARSAKVTGKATANAERSAKVTGKATTNAERAAKITGKATANAERAAKITGKSTSNAERAAKVTGKNAANDARDAKVTGKAVSTSERAAKVTGVATTNDTRSAKITGTLGANAERAAKITGIATTNDSRNAKITGKETANAERAAKITGTLGANAERNAKVIGNATANAERAAKVTGKLTATAERAAKVTGNAQATADRSAKITGKNTANAERSAKVTGKIATSAERPAKITGKATANAERNAKTTGSATNNDTRSAKVTGKVSTVDSRSAKVVGKLTTQAERAATVVGKAATSAERGAKITGKAEISAERSAKILGTTSIFQGYAERSAKVIGTGPWYDPNPQPFQTNQTGAFKTNNNPDWYEDDPTPFKTTPSNDWNTKY